MENIMMIKRFSTIIFIVVLSIAGVACADTRNELSFSGEAYHKNPERAREKAKNEALEKMLLFLAGIDINEERIDKITYFKDFSNSGIPQEKGRINFSRTLTITSGKLKGLRVRIESSCSREDDTFHAVAFVFVDRKEAERTMMRKELEIALLEIEDNKEVCIQLPQVPGNCLREAITVLAKRFASAIETVETASRIAVLEIAGDSNDIVREEIIHFLSRKKGYQVIERGDIGQILREQKLCLTGIIGPDSAVPYGKILGVNGIIFGRIQKVEQKDKRVSVEAYLKIVNTESGRIIWAGVVKGYATEGPKTKETGKHIVFGIISSGIILATLYFGYSKGFILSGSNPTPMGLFMMLFSTGIILILYRFFYGHIPEFFLSILRSLGMVD